MYAEDIQTSKHKIWKYFLAIIRQTFLHEMSEIYLYYITWWLCFGGRGGTFWLSSLEVEMLLVSE